MCLYVKKGCDIEVTKKPIIVWKRVHTLNEKSWQAIFQNGYGPYPFGEILHANKWGYCPNGVSFPIEHLTIRVLEYNTIDGGNVIENHVTEGFHAYTSYLFARGHNKSHDLKPCIIPPKTEIVKGSNKEIVALKMIVCRDRKEMRKILKQYKKK